MENAERVAELLQEVNDNQKRLLQRQEESLQLQREHIRLLQGYLEHSSDYPRAQEHREQEHSAGLRLQTRGNRMVDRGLQMFLVIIFLLVILLFFVSWALFSQQPPVPG